MTRTNFLTRNATRPVYTADANPICNRQRGGGLCAGACRAFCAAIVPRGFECGTRSALPLWSASWTATPHLHVCCSQARSLDTERAHLDISVTTTSD